MERKILLFWRQSRGGVLMFAAGGEPLERGQLLHLAFGGSQQFAYSVAVIYEPAQPAALIEQYYNVWESVLDPAQVAEIRAGIQRVRATPDCQAYLLKLEGLRNGTQAIAQVRPQPGSPRNN